MTRLRLENSFVPQKSSFIRYYVWIEMCVWAFMTYSAIYHGKIFDYEHYKTQDFVAHMKGSSREVAGGNWYYRLMFGNLKLSNIDFEHQQSIQVKCDTLNTLFVFVFGLYFILSIFFLIGMSKKLGSKCLLCPYVTYDLSVLISIAVFVVYGTFKKLYILHRNGGFFILIRLFPSMAIFTYYRSLAE